MDSLFSCNITAAMVTDAWREWVGDDTAEAPLYLLDDVPGSFVAAAMEDAALTMIRVLLVDKALQRRSSE